MSDNSEARFKILNPKNNLHSEYKTGDYKQIYISVAGLPLHDQDWQFTDRSADDLIVIDGGRIRGNYLEICEARIFSKITNTKSIFNKLRRLVAKICSTKGLYTQTGLLYKNIYYDNRILDYEFHFDLIHKNPAHTFVREDDLYILESQVSKLMNIDLSHPGLDARRKKKVIQRNFSQINWIKVSEESEWIWASIESEKEMITFSQWIASQPISYPVKVILFDSQLNEISNLLSFNEFDIANLFKTTATLYLVANNMEWMIEYRNVQVARFGTMNI